MTNFTEFYCFLFGALTIAGGAMGYVKAKSTASLVAGGVSGLLLMVAGALIASGSATAGLVLALVVSILLAGRFLPAFLKKKNWMPAGMMAVLSVIGIVLAALALIQR